MKSDIEKRLENVRNQREALQRTEEELQKQLEAENTEFDFKAKMPVGSVWLDCRPFEVEYMTETGPYFRGNPEPCFRSIYHAHQIVKAAQRYIKGPGSHIANLGNTVKAAEEDGVLQDLE